MIKYMARCLILNTNSLCRQRVSNLTHFASNIHFRCPIYAFCKSNKDEPNTESLTPGTQIPQQNLQIQHERVQIGKETVDAYETKGAISILDQLKGTKLTETGQLYALVFRCGKCNTRSIRSFTKNAYHHGVVLLRCEGCQNVHLVADNLGWFESSPDNIQGGLAQETVKLVNDPVAVVKYLKTIFDSQPAGQFPDNKQK